MRGTPVIGFLLLVLEVCQSGGRTLAQSCDFVYPPGGLIDAQ